VRRKKGRGEDEWITTHTGKMFWPAAPKEEEVDIRDIAWGLSHQCRWTGQCRKFYSIAQHSVRVMLAIQRNVPEFGPVSQMFGLLHDASEAYIADVSRPLKHQPGMAGYRKYEKVLEDVIYRAMGLVPLYEDELGEIKAADISLLAKEALELMPAIGVRGEARHIQAPYYVRSERPRGPMFSYYRFLYHFHRLSGEISGKSGLLNNATALFRSLFR
jgi:hypothetical protein